MDEKLVDKLESIDWSKYAAAHGSADAMVEDDVENDDRPFLKKLFSGPPPKEKVGNIKDFLIKFHDKEEERALWAYKYFSSSVCRNEFVTSAALPSYPFLKSALGQAVENENFRLANNILELLKGFAINARRQALYPKGDWGKELESEIKEDVVSFKEYLDVNQISDYAKELIEVLEFEPPSVIKLNDQIEGLQEGEIRFFSSSQLEKIQSKLNELEFKVYSVDCGNIEMELELINNIGQTLELSEDELNPVDNWSWSHFIDTINNEFHFDGASHVAILCTGLTSALSTIKETILEEAEILVMAAQHRDDTIISGPIQKEFFFFCDQSALEDLIESKNAASEKNYVCFDPNNVEYFKTKAVIAVDKEEFADALKYFSKAVELEPDDFALYRQRAQIYRLLNQYQSAIDDCTKALELDEHAMAYCERARSHLALNNFEDAISDCQKEIEQSQEDEVESWVPYHLIALAQIELEEYESAKESLDKSLKLQVTKDAYNSRSLVHEKLGEQEKAQDDKLKAVETAQGDPGVL